MTKYWIAFVLLLSTLPASAYAQNAGNPKPLIPEAAKVEKAYMAMKNHPGNSLYEKQFILAFPRNWKTFLDVYQPPDFSQLYEESADQICFTMPALSDKYPERVGSLLVGLSKDGHYDSDAPACLQDVTAKFAAKHTSLFVRLFRQLSSSEQKNLVKFLADVANFEAYPEYKQIISHLESSGNRDLAKKFKRAKQARMKEGDC